MLIVVLLLQLLLQLLPPQGIRPLLIGQLQAQEVPPQGGLPGDVCEAAGGFSQSERRLVKVGDQKERHVDERLNC